MATIVRKRYWFIAGKLHKKQHRTSWRRRQTVVLIRKESFLFLASQDQWLSASSTCPLLFLVLIFHYAYLPTYPICYSGRYGLYDLLLCFPFFYSEARNIKQKSWLIDWRLRSQSNCGCERRRSVGLRNILSCPPEGSNMRRNLDTRRPRLNVPRRERCMWVYLPLKHSWRRRLEIESAEVKKEQRV